MVSQLTLLDTIIARVKKNSSVRRNPKFTQSETNSGNFRSGRFLKMDEKNSSDASIKKNSCSQRSRSLQSQEPFPLLDTSYSPETDALKNRFNFSIANSAPTLVASTRKPMLGSEFFFFSYFSVLTDETVDSILTSLYLNWRWTMKKTYLLIRKPKNLFFISHLMKVT